MQVIIEGYSSDDDVYVGRLPKEGDVAEWDGWRLEIIDMDRRRIDKVLAVKVKTAPKQEGRGE